jgi:hypothetical protein
MSTLSINIRSNIDLLDCGSSASSDSTISTEADSMSSCISSLSSSLQNIQHHCRVRFGTVTIRHYSDKPIHVHNPKSGGAVPKEQTGDIGQYEQARGREPLPWCCMLISTETESKRKLGNRITPAPKRRLEPSKPERKGDME